MSSRCPPRPLAAALLALLLAGCGGGAVPSAPLPPSASAPVVATAAPTMPAQPDTLRVCADPNNLPFSNDRLEGFENRIAALIADELDAALSYTWWAQRRGFIRNTLRAGRCDLVVGVPSSFELAATTAPYYRSTYVFVYRQDAPFTVRSFDDPVLRTLRVGVQIVGDDFANTPPVHALSNRGIVENVVGYTLYGDYSRPSPPSRIIEAVAEGEVDVAVAWGPMAGYFARRQAVPLAVVPVAPQIDPPYLPFVFDIAMGVRRGETPFLEELDRILAEKRPQIEAILDAYGVPRVDAAQPAS